MELIRPDRFDIPGLSPEWQDNVNEAFAKVLGSNPQPIAPEKENEQ